MGPCHLILQMPFFPHFSFLLSPPVSPLPTPILLLSSPLSVISYLHKAPPQTPNPCRPGPLQWSLGKGREKPPQVALALGKPAEDVRRMQVSALWKLPHRGPSSACFLVFRPGWSLSLGFRPPVGKGYGLSLRGELYSPRAPGMMTMVAVNSYHAVYGLLAVFDAQR